MSQRVECHLLDGTDFDTSQIELVGRLVCPHRGEMRIDIGHALTVHTRDSDKVMGSSCSSRAVFPFEPQTDSLCPYPIVKASFVAWSAIMSHLRQPIPITHEIGVRTAAQGLIKTRYVLPAMPFDKQIFGLLEETGSFLEYASRFPGRMLISLVIHAAEKTVWGLQISAKQLFAQLSSEDPNKIFLEPYPECREKIPVQLYLGPPAPQNLTPRDVVQRARDAVIMLAAPLMPAISLEKPKS